MIQDMINSDNMNSTESTIPNIFKTSILTKHEQNLGGQISSCSILCYSCKIWHSRELFNFYPILGYYKIRTRTNFENPNGKSLDLHLMM